MKTALAAAAVVASALISAPAFAADVAQLAKDKACMSCHAVDKAVIGPAYKDVAAKYKGQKDAVAKLAEKVQKGGGGVWKMPMAAMPANNVTPAEAKQLVEWVLSQK